MSKRVPPVPPASRSNKGPGGAAKGNPRPQATGDRPVPDNLAEQGRQGNVAQNTTNQGYQQDR